jgi:hypothetical protein
MSSVSINVQVSVHDWAELTSDEARKGYLAALRKEDDEFLTELLLLAMKGLHG